MLQPSNSKWANIFLKSFIFSQFKHLIYIFAVLLSLKCTFMSFADHWVMFAVKFSHSNIFLTQPQFSRFVAKWVIFFVVTHIWRKNVIVFFTVSWYFVYKILDFLSCSLIINFHPHCVPVRGRDRTMKSAPTSPLSGWAPLWVGCSWKQPCLLASVDSSTTSKATIKTVSFMLLLLPSRKVSWACVAEAVGVV